MASVKRVTIDFPEELYRTIKAFTAFQDSTIKDFVLGAVSRDLIQKKIKIPNLETIQTFKDTDAGKNIEDYESFNDLLKDIQK